MRTLRLTQSELGPERYRVEAALEVSGQARQIVTSEFDFRLSDQDREDLRWYLEDYLEHTADPAPRIATRIEARMVGIGHELFKALFQSSEDARDLWATARSLLSDTRVEIVTGVRGATALPWELVRDPKTDAPLALRADAFVRAAHQGAQAPYLPPETVGQIRILLVICRPGGKKDVPFRSVASRLIKSLQHGASGAFQLDVLRPPTFEHLSEVLRRAKAEGNPYHVVHFDGHGAFIQRPSSPDPPPSSRRLNPLKLSAPRDGSHGYLAFENPALEDNEQLVDGPALGRLLVETKVPILVLNACRSAHAEAPAEPVSSGTDAQLPSNDGDAHAKVRAFGSLAQEVVDAGVAGVVAMRYNVYVVTAAQFVADLYESLAEGHALGEAVTLGRKQLDAQPLREIAYQPRPLQDWMVPVVYEAAPLALFPKRTPNAEWKVTIRADAAAPTSKSIARELERRPDAGFFGRDETLLALDRCFDTQGIVLLHAYAGSGKTSTAAEFARWYQLTGGIEGPVFFTSFEHKTTLGQALNDTIGRVFAPALERDGIHWPALSDDARRDISLQILASIPVLWVWDNVEPVAGFPEGSSSAWSLDEQQALVDFLRDAQQTRAKFLLTSRRDERGWLGDLPARIAVARMPMRERILLARALAEKSGRRLTEVEDWLPLLRFTEGNPLTITALVGQALRDGLKTRAEIEAFVVRLRAGEEAFDDEESEGRSKSLGASLSYGFQNAFSDEERRQIALLHLFQGFVDVDALVHMQSDLRKGAAVAYRAARAAGIALLDRATEVGLLAAQGGGYYFIHPALPWFFKKLFDSSYPRGEAQPVSLDEEGVSPARAFAKAMDSLGSFYNRNFDGTKRDQVIDVLRAEESNLLHAYQLALSHRWWDEMTGVMQGVRALYETTGRWAELRRLVDDFAPNVMDPKTKLPLPGSEEMWRIATDFLVRLAFEDRRWDDAERMERPKLEYCRAQAAPALASPPEAIDEHGKFLIHNVIASLHELATIEAQQGKASCVATFQECIDLCQRIGDISSESGACLNLGVAYLTMREPPDLEAAEKVFKRGLALVPEADTFAKSQFLSELGFIAFERLNRAVTMNEPSETLNTYLTEAIRCYENALALTPEVQIKSLVVKHNALGALYGKTVHLDRALEHFRHAIRYIEMQGDQLGASQVRANVASNLFRAGRLLDAREYARAAVAGLKGGGPPAAAAAEQADRLLSAIETALKEERP